MLKKDQERVSKGSGGCQEEARRGQNEVKKGQEGVRMRSRRLRANGWSPFLAPQGHPEVHLD